MSGMMESVWRIADLGGPVVMLLIMISIVTMATAIYTLWQFSIAGVGRHRLLQDAVRLWDQGDKAGARWQIAQSKSYLAPVIDMVFSHGQADSARLASEAENRFARLERGFRMLDSVAQLAPLLGLFGTVLGMIDAFQSLQDAGSQVDPSLLAGGIWVALLTTAVGLAVAMPTSAILSWFESRMDAERVMAETAIATILAPQGKPPTRVSPQAAELAYA